jgi:hypothetical protein
VDPFPGLPALPQTQHPYVYVGNNPINLVDPSGKFNVPGAALGAVAGGIIGAGAYALSVNPCSEQFNVEDMLLVAGTGALAGGFIGSGIGILALAGAGASSSGLGYLTTNFVFGAEFSRKDFGISVGVGGVAGAVTPWAAATTLGPQGGVIAVESTASMVQYSLTELAGGRKPKPVVILTSGIIGGFSGWATGSHTSFESKYRPKFQWLEETLIERSLEEQVIKTTIRGLPRSSLISAIDNILGSMLGIE